MKACVFGAGAIGGHLAARLARGGAEVSVVARGAQLAAIEARGLTVKTAEGDLACWPKASADPRELGQQDVVLVCVKAPALPVVAATIAPLLGPDTSVVFVTNGIPWWFFCGMGGARDGASVPEADPGDAVRKAVGIQRTIGSVVYAASAVIEPGVIELESGDARLVLGEPDDQQTPRVKAISDLLAAGGLSAPIAPKIRPEVFAKFLGNALSGPLCVLSRNDMATMLVDPATRAAARAIAQEVLALSEAYGAPIPVNLDQRVARATTMRHKPSILQDLEAGRPMETAVLYDAPLRLARDAGVPMPTFELVATLARQVAQGAGLATGPAA